MWVDPDQAGDTLSFTFCSSVPVFGPTGGLGGGRSAQLRQVRWLVWDILPLMGFIG